MESFLDRYDIPAASFAVTTQGRLVYHRAFGTADLDAEVETEPHHLFRIASLSKPITGMAIMKLVDEGRLELSDRVFGSGGLLAEHPELSGASYTDARIEQITVQQLLEHSAGWDRDQNCFPAPTTPYPWNYPGCDPIGVPLHVTQTLGISNPVTEPDMIAFLLREGLAFEPGSRYAYSNIGYLALGEVIAEVSGMSYEAYVKSALLEPLGICDMHLGSTRREDKFSREVDYAGNGFTSLDALGSGETVPMEYGGWHLGAMGAHGGWVASSRSLLRLLAAVDGFPSKPDLLSNEAISTMTTASSTNSFYAKGWSVNSANNWWHTGALDGTATLLVRTNGQMTWTVLLNKRVIGNRANAFWGDLDGLPWQCLSAAGALPGYDLFDVPLTNGSDLTATTIGSTDLNLSWTRGSGDESIVVARKSDSPERYPLDGFDYQASSGYQLGDDLGQGNYIVYRGTGSSVALTDLEADTEYTLSVYELNRGATTGGHSVYKLCGSEPLQVKTERPTSTGEAREHSLSLYPTVTTGELLIRGGSLLREASYQVISLHGVPLMKGSVSGGQARIDVADLPKGAYIFRLRGRGGVRTARFVRQ